VSAPDADLDFDPVTTIVRPEWGYRLGSIAASLLGLALVGLFGVFVLRPASDSLVYPALAAIGIAAIGLAVAWLALLLDGRVGAAPMLATLLVAAVAYGSVLAGESVVLVPAALIGFPIGMLLVGGVVRAFAIGALACVAVALVGMASPQLLIADGMLAILGNAALAFAISFAMPAWRARELL
jgi:hypothetical protein